MLALAWQNVLRMRPALNQFPGQLVAWCLLATGLLAFTTLNGPAPSLAEWLGDTDDAVRLVTVRELLAGAPWFDTTLPRVGAPEPLLSHWSRLIDAPLACLIAVLTPIFGPEHAELATRMIWPALLFFALLLIVACEADRHEGAWAAGCALVLVVTSATALAQFRLGRVDHHNAQILCAVAGFLFLVRGLEDKRMGWIAGLLIGLGLAIGYEAIALIVLGLAAAAVVAVWQPRFAPGVARAATGATATMSVALLLTIPPARWFDVRCDALSPNLPVLAACCTMGLWAILAAKAKPATRLALLAAASGIGAALFGALEPACLAGPFGQVDPALKSLWLDHVMEGQSVLWFAGRHPTMALAFICFVGVAAAAQVAIWRRDRDVASGVAAAIVAMAALLGCWQIKLMPYACWLAVLPLARFCATVRGTATISAPVARIAAVIVLSQATLEAGFAALALPLREGTSAVASRDVAYPSRPCFRSANVSRLAALPPGLVAAELDLGPFIVALSPHRVVAAPYHRLSKSILLNTAILNGTPDEALRTMRTLGVDYVALCADAKDVGKLESPPAENTTLQSRLLRGVPVGFLHELDLGPGAAIRAWRIVPAR
jgi:hypothetical protein